MPIKKKCSGSSCALPARKPADLTSLGTSTPVGYSFYSAFDDCERYWANRYIFQVFPTKRASAPTLGSAYHHLQEHDGARDYAEATVEEMEEAKRLYRARQHGPPMPPALAREKLYEMSGPIPFTVRPDRVESATAIRDFKSAGNFYEDTDEARWNTEPSIIGQLVAGPFEVCHVDVITKEKAPRTRIFSVRLNADKREVFLRWLRDVFDRVVERLTDLASFSGHIELLFPRKLGHCIKYTKLCPYYARCWEGGSAESLAYVTGKGERKWFKHFVQADVLLKSTVKDLQALFKKL